MPQAVLIILFGYEINVFSYHKNMVYAATLIELQWVMCWQLILKEFGPNIQHICEAYNIVSDTLSRFPSTHVDNYKPGTSKSQCCANKSFLISRSENS